MSLSTFQFPLLGSYQNISRRQYYTDITFNSLYWVLTKDDIAYVAAIIHFQFPLLGSLEGSLKSGSVKPFNSLYWVHYIVELAEKTIGDSFNSLYWVRIER